MSNQRPRKTIPVADAVGMINDMLRDSVPEYQEARVAMGIIASNILMDSNTYAGFQWIGEGNERGEIDETRKRFYLGRVPK